MRLGGSDTLTKTNYITVTEPVVAGFSAGPLTGTAPLTVTFTNNTTTPDTPEGTGGTGGDIYTYLWDFGDGASSTDPNPQHLYDIADVYTVSLTVSTPEGTGGPGGSDTLVEPHYITVTEGTVAATITSTPFTQTVVGQVYSYTVTAAGSPGPTYTLVSGPAGMTIDAISGLISWTPSLTGSFSVTVAASNPAGSDSQNFTLEVIATVQANFSAFPYSDEAPALIQFFDNATGNIDSYLWDFGDGNTSSLPSPTNTYTIPGVYTVSLTVSTPDTPEGTGGGGPGGSDTLTRPNYITVTEATDEPITGLSAANNSPAELNQPAILSATISTGTNVSYGWDFGDGTQAPDSGPIITHSYPATGTYTVMVTATNSASQMAATTTVTIIGLPELTIAKTGPASVLAGEPITYTLTVMNEGESEATNLVITDTLPPGANYVAGNGGTQVGNVVSWTLTNLTPNAGTNVRFAVTADESITNSDYAVTASEGVSAVGQTVVETVVYEPVVANFSAFPLNWPVPALIQFLDNSTGVESTDPYLWDFGDGITSTLPSPTHTYTAAGVYTVSLTVSTPEGTGGPEGSDAQVEPGYITVTAPVIEEVDLIPVGEEWQYWKGTAEPPASWNVVGFDDSGWSSGPTGIGFGDGDDATVLSDMQNNYLTVFARRVFTLENPAAVNSLTFEMDYDDGFVAYLNGTEIAADGVGSRAYDARATSYHEAGTPVGYDLRAYLDQLQAGQNVLAVQGHNGGLSSSDFSLVPALRAELTSAPPARPEAGFVATSLAGATPLVVSFSNTSVESGNTNYEWDFGDGATSTAANPTHVYSRAGVYDVTLTADNGSVTDTLTMANYIRVEQAALVEVGEEWQYWKGTAEPPASWNVVGFDDSGWSSGPTGIGFGDGDDATVLSDMQNNYLTVFARRVFTLENPAAVNSLTFEMDYDDGFVAYLNGTEIAADGVGSRAYDARATSYHEAGTPVGYDLRAYLDQLQAGQNVLAVQGHNGGFSSSDFSLVPALRAELDQIVYEPITGLNASNDSPTVLSQATSLTATISAGTNVSYTWTFGDGTTSPPGGGLITTTHTYTQVGVYTAVVTASNSVNEMAATTTVTIIGLPELTLAKTGPASVLAGEPITYTLTVMNEGESEATNLAITDTLPPGANYVVGSGGTQVGNVVSWTVPNLAPNTGTSVQFAVTATKSITNSDYAVVAEGGVSTVGEKAVMTLIYDWRLITTPLSPPVVGEQAMAYDSAREVVVLYGGNATGWPYENTTWEFDGTDWYTSTQGPNARYGAQLAYDGSQIILFGGSDESDTALNQTWVYTNIKWVNLSPATAPLSRTYHSLAADPISGTIYLFGGNDQTTYFNDLWQYENGEWTEISIIGDQPSIRTLAALTYDPDNNRLLLFGGRSVTGTLLADLWAFDPSTETWQLLEDGGGGGGPPARQAHSLTYDPATGHAVLVGGTTDEGDTLLGDTWHYGDSGWTEATPATTLPARAYHQAVYTPAGIVLFSNGEVWGYE